MSEKEYIENIIGPFGVDRRDSAVAKQAGILFELTNFLIHNGNAEVREGVSNAFSTINGNDITSLQTGYQILSLFRYYGLTATEEELKEFYAAVDGTVADGSTLRKWDGSKWVSLTNPPGMILAPHADTPGSERPPSLGNFEQFKDRTYYTNQKQPILMVKKEDDQIYEAGVPEANAELMIADCEALANWLFYANNVDDDEVTFEEDYELHYLDGGFERHTQGDFGITLERSSTKDPVDGSFLGSRVKAVRWLPDRMDLEWFWKITPSPNPEVTTANSDGVRLITTEITFTEAYVGLQLKNVTDGSTTIITKWISANIVLTTQLTGGTNNDYEVGDAIIIGSYSTINDYIAIDIFRFNSIDIDELTIQLSSVAPDSNGDFSKGFHVTMYADSDFEHYALRQKSMMAEWAMNPYPNVLFQGRFRKAWFIDIDEGTPDDWSLIKYVRIQLQQNKQSTGDGIAKVTFDNIRLLKTPPLPAELRVQVATCDAREQWVNVTAGGGTLIANDYARATEGVSCKIIPTVTFARYTFPASKNLEQYGEGTLVDGSDVFIFDICGGGSATYLAIGGALKIGIWLTDGSGGVVKGIFTAFQDIGNLQQRHINVQDFVIQGTDFDWSDVVKLELVNGVGADYANYPWTLGCYVDNIRIQPATASKVINKFAPLDLIIADSLNRGIQHFFGENSFVDAISDLLFHAYAKFTRQATGQGSMIFPEYQHGRYKLGGGVAAPSLQLNVDAGGSFTVSFVQDNDLSQYEDFNFNLDAFWNPQQDDDQNSWLGMKWVEVQSTPTDEFSIWFSSPNPIAIAKIIFRFYCNKNANWDIDIYTHVHGAGQTGTDDTILTKNAGGDFDDAQWVLLGKRIRNDTQKKWGIVSAVHNANQISAWGLTWNDGDRFTIHTYRGKGFTFDLENGISKPSPDFDNYYEYTVEMGSKWGKSAKGVIKGLGDAISQANENEEVIEAGREALFEGYNLNTIYTENVGGQTWLSGILKWKRQDMIAHFSEDSPWASFQAIASHEIMVIASTKQDATINFQDYMMTKKGAVKGEQIRYKIRLEDELGFLGPASDASKAIDVAGNDINVSDLYVPYDARIKRKRLYRTDTLGVFRHLDTIERIKTNYIDTIPEENLGQVISENVYRPPKAAHIRKVDNRMAYIDCIDRRGTRRTSRVHLSLPFIPHQCRDADCFDLIPEDGQKTVWCEWYYGYLLVWKERSFYAIDPNTFAKTPRDLSIGCIAPLSVATIPNIGFGWLSHEGVIFGDQSSTDKLTGLQIWDDIKGYTPQQLSHAFAFYQNNYYYIFLGYDDGVYNTKGFACYIPEKRFTTLEDINVQCGTIFKGGTDDNEIYIGTDFGHVYRLFDGEIDISDDATRTETPIRSVLRTLDLDLSRPQANKYAEWILLHAKNLSDDPTRKALITITPHYDQIPTKALDTFKIEHDHYKRYDSCVDPGYEDRTTLLGFRIVGSKRYAIKGMVIDATDEGFQPFEKSGQY